MGKTHWKVLANYDYIGAYSLEDIAEEITITISKVQVEMVTAPGGKKEDCIIAHFEEKYMNGVTIKPMVLNKTNCNIITNLYGPFIEDWVGKKITIYATTTKMARDIVPCLRIKKETPKGTEYFCENCGCSVEEKLALTTQKHYGAVFCSKECYEKNKINIEGEE